MDVCTIIAKNYVAHARVLARSLAAIHPDVRFCVLFIDDVDGFVDPRDEPFHVVTVQDLAIDAFDRMAALYDVVELSTAVKPWLLRRLIGESGAALYLDPDTRLYAPLDGVFDAIERHGLVLSPHSLDPLPRDGKRPNEQDILIAGTYNLGLIGIRAGDFADTLLAWWSERLETDCIVDPTRGFFVDQRWIDLVPGMADSFHLLRDRGVNVAYWNLDSRPIGRAADGTWLAGSVPLRLFHFSGFDERRPHLLSRHQDRISLADEPDLAQLCRDYAGELLAAGRDESRSWPYTYARTASGVVLTAPIRAVYRTLVKSGEPVPSLFEPAGERRFLDHLNAPAPAALGGAAGITTYLAALYELRADLRRAYPDLRRSDAAGYLGWACVFGRAEVPAELRPAAVGTSTAPAPTAAPPARPGVNVAGYLNSELGVGEVARQAIRALDAAGVPVLPVGVRAPDSRERHGYAHTAVARGGHGVNLVCVNADMLPGFAAAAGPELFAGRHTIGWWWWEVTRFPERWLGAFEHLDELWVGSRFVADALAPISPVPVLRMPTPVSLAGTPRSQPERFGLPPGFVFLFSFDYASVVERKNPLGLVEAFLRAFPKPGEAILVLKSIDSARRPGDHERVRLAAAGHPHVVMLDAYLDPADKDRLMASCDCYVSLHRSEGFGITLAEAMLLGKPVVATAWSGNVDFMTAQNSYLVDYELTSVGPDLEPYPADAVWAEPDLDHAAALMREVFEDRDGALQRARRGAEDLRRSHSLAAAGAAMAHRLGTIAARVPLTGTGWEAPAALDRAYRAGDVLKAGPGGGRGGRARRFARRLALRLARPLAAHQTAIHGEAVGALQAVARDVRLLGERAVATESLALRGLRDAEDRLRSLVEPELAADAARADELAARVDAARVDLDAGADRIDELASRLDAVRLDHDAEAARVDELAGRMDGVRGDHDAAAARIDELVSQVDELRAELRFHAQLLSVPGQAESLAGNGHTPGLAVPWSESYEMAHAAFVGRSLDDAALVRAIRAGHPLPAGYGVGFDERVVEFPWLAGRDLAGSVLDAGSALNQLHVLRRLRTRMDDLHIVTLAPEDRAFATLGVSYLFADLRELPYSDDAFDRVLSISTLEHVGMDLRHFGATSARAADPQRAALAAVDELRRVLRPGGEALLTLPIGVAESFDWVRSLSVDELDEVVERFGPRHVEIAFFRFDGCWTRCERSAVTGARYRDHLAGEGPRGGVVAAEAIACVALTVR